MSVVTSSGVQGKAHTSRVRLGGPGAPGQRLPLGYGPAVHAPGVSRGVSSKSFKVGLVSVCLSECDHLLTYFVSAPLQLPDGIMALCKCCIIIIIIIIIS